MAGSQSLEKTGNKRQGQRLDPEKWNGKNGGGHRAQKKWNQTSGARPGPGKTERNERPGLGTRGLPAVNFCQLKKLTTVNN